MTQAPVTRPDIPPGSTDYYIVRFAPEDKRNALAHVLAWRGALEGLRHLSEPQVALAKASWWQDELERAFTGKAQHPLAVGLAAAASEGLLDRPALLDIARAYHRHLSAGPYADPEQVAQHHRASSGACAILAHRIAGNGHEGTVDESTAAACGGYFGAVECLCRLGSELRAVQPLVPRSTLATHGIANHQDVASSEALIADLCEQARALRPDVQGRLPHPLGGLLAVADASLREIRRSGPAVYEAALELTPIRKLWLVWRNR